MYEAGVFIALAIWFLKILWAFQQINSNINYNLKQIGQRLSWLDLSPKPITQDYLQQGGFYKFIKFSLIWVIVPFFFTFTSWLYVIYSIGLILYKKNKDSGKPQEIKEAQWRLKNQKLTFDQVVDVIIKMNNIDESKTEEFKDAIKSQMSSSG
ncbi:hypothetical protein IC794_06665 [Acinetobacter seifertii]|uniref:hypothetical protein n=1 Tax=Acinetobacter calcoaceticus/baumannii complex TaxID=909768 RepID=UPI00168A5065|nr:MULTISPECIES: hypothetical protein [Acinetobacter calcoaceticus/baumannii complex]QNX13388.1 hypothetical protein IC794_06375 [Acinetobacter seifertii]QNX13436.1 hypothetical protein IC794_06665 [Acinetobacter seifertii]QNX46386.1 hypothetical protein IC785_06960 [Acinetobacter seifertii]QNX53564.1 hypothetical protein IC783_06570 [Acinetobacter seifertii]QNX53618.1 hypothetical protein IC783_06865 [Acinetobacter seifertii]